MNRFLASWRACSSGVSQSPVQQFSGWPNKRPALQIFLVARVLANEHDFCMGHALAKNGWGATFP
jgi:hypothetical protein